MLLQTVFIRDDKIILKDMDDSEVELIPEDALDLFLWIRNHRAAIHEARQRFNKRAKQYSDEKMNEDSQTDE